MSLLVSDRICWSLIVFVGVCLLVSLLVSDCICWRLIVLAGVSICLCLTTVVGVCVCPHLLEKNTPVWYCLAWFISESWLLLSSVV